MRQVEQAPQVLRVFRVALQIRVQQEILGLRVLLAILVKMVILVKWGHKVIRVLPVPRVFLVWL